MLELEQIVERMKGRDIKALSKASGIHYNVVYRLSRGKITNPEYKTFKKLSDFLEAEASSAESPSSEGGA